MTNKDFLMKNKFDYIIFCLNIMFIITFLYFLFLEGIGHCKEIEQWDTELEAGYSLSKGNTDKEELYGSIDTKYLYKTHEFQLFGSIRLAESNSIRNEETYTGKFKYDKALNDKVSLFVFKGIERNKFKKINIRYYTGSGTKYTFIEGLSLSGAVLYEHERANSITYDITRLSIRPKLKYGVFTFTLFYQPNVVEYKDYRIDGIAEIKLPVTDHLSLKTKCEYRYDSMPEDGIERDDMRFLTSLVWGF